MATVQPAHRHTDPGVRTSLNDAGTAILFGLGGDATVPQSLDAAVEHASRVLALVMEARRIGGAAA